MPTNMHYLLMCVLEHIISCTSHVLYLMNIKSAFSTMLGMRLTKLFKSVQDSVRHNQIYSVIKSL